MNVLDTTNITIVCYLLSRQYIDDEAIEILTILLIPAAAFVRYIIYRIFPYKKNDTTMLEILLECDTNN